MPKRAPDAAENTNKIKLVKLLEILRQETDESNSLTTAQITRKLAELGIPCDTRTVPKDMATLNQFGYEVMQEKIGHDNHFWIDDGSFSLPELKILIDAVQAASFIPQKKSDELIMKIAELGGSNKKELLTGNLVRFNTRKHSNLQILYNVEALEAALRSKRKASFYYYDLNENHIKSYRKGKERYIVEPMSLVYVDDNYYLLSYNAKYDSTTTYRVDRMENVRCEEELVSSESKVWETDIAEFAEQSFKMYSGEIRTVRLRFSNKIMNAIYDKFGEETKIIRVDENSCEAVVSVQVSRMFWGWVFAFADEMEIVEPADMREAFRQELKSKLSTVEDTPEKDGRITL